MADATDLKSVELARVGSSPTTDTTNINGEVIKMMPSGWSVRNISIDLGWSSYSTVNNKIRARDYVASDNEMNDLYN